MNQEKRLTMLLSGRIYEEQEVTEIIQKIVDKLLQYSTKIHFMFMDEKTMKKILVIYPEASCQILTPSNSKTIDYVITVGGDGTILYTAKELKHTTPPFLSFQKGTLGFLCRFATNQINQVLDQTMVAHGMKETDQEFPFIVSKTMRLEGELCYKEQGKCLQPKICLNQLYISRVSSERIILDIYVDDEFLTQTAGDGILVSTPTGSTAYALSAGGPIVQNGVNSILIVPIAPNSLSFRPICLPSSCKIRVKLSKNSRSEGYISFDGQMNEHFKKEDEINIKASDKDLIFYEQRFGESKMPTWMQRLKHFLGWNEVFKSPHCNEIKAPRKFVKGLSVKILDDEQ